MDNNKEKIAIRQKQYYNKNRLKILKKAAIARRDLKDCYVRSKLRRQGIQNEKITPELIEQKRKDIAKYRLELMILHRWRKIFGKSSLKQVRKAWDLDLGTALKLNKQITPGR